jgi:hypothetical protein
MKTYTEIQGKAPFDWNAFLSKESYTEEELLQAKGLSKEWVTCACGNLCNVIPRYDNGEPEDIMLVIRGASFHVCISMMYASLNNNVSKFYYHKEKAIFTLHAIEQRSQQIINELNKK